MAQHMRGDMSGRDEPSFLKLQKNKHAHCVEFFILIFLRVVQIMCLCLCVMFQVDTFKVTPISGKLSYT